MILENVRLDRETTWLMPFNRSASMRIGPLRFHHEDGEYWLSWTTPAGGEMPLLDYHGDLILWSRPAPGGVAAEALLALRDISLGPTTFVITDRERAFTLRRDLRDEASGRWSWSLLGATTAHGSLLQLKSASEAVGRMTFDGWDGRPPSPPRKCWPRNPARPPITARSKRHARVAALPPH